MKTDYKFSNYSQDDNGKFIRAVVRFYEGDFSTKRELDADNKMNDVYRYRHIKRLREEIYTPADFGDIYDADELRIFCNKELAKDTTRESIDVQKETNLTKLKLQPIR